MYKPRRRGFDTRANDPAAAVAHNARMPLEGHWARQHSALPSTSLREGRVLLAVAIAALLAALVVVVLALQRQAPAPAAGCVEVVAASTTGGATYRACGSEAAAWCRDSARKTDAVAREVVRQCRRAGYPLAGGGA